MFFHGLLYFFIRLQKLRLHELIFSDLQSKERMRFHTMTLRGDWKFLKQCLNLSRNAQTENICFSCLASKGNHNPAMNFTDLSDSAEWKKTVFKSPTPWHHPPAFAKLQFFCIEKVGLDLLHIWHLGVCRDLTLGQVLDIFVRYGFGYGFNYLLSLSL